VRSIFIHFVSVVIFSSSLLAFSQADDPANTETSMYLMRVQRKTEGNSICVLLRHDAQFHLETAHGDRIKVMEGSLPGSELLKVQQMLDNDGLPRLSQETLGSPRMTRGSEVLQISIFRTNHWQNLIFMDDNGSQTVPRDLPRFSHPCRTEDLSVSANSLGVR
jgi:hypothetical protein